MERGGGLICVGGLTGMKAGMGAPGGRRNEYSEFTMSEHAPKRVCAGVERSAGLVVGRQSPGRFERVSPYSIP